LKITQLNIDTGHVITDLKFVFYEIAGHLEFNIDYNTDLFRKETIEMISGTYVTLLRQIVHDPTLRPGEFSITDSEKTVSQKSILTEFSFPDIAPVISDTQQNYSSYAPEDHRTWCRLVHRQTRLVMKYACDEYKKALHKLKVDAEHIPDLYESNHELKKHCDWSLVATIDMIAPKDLLYLLKNKQFPISTNIRDSKDLNFSKVPDIFHDFFGHVPLLTNRVFADFLFKYAAAASPYADDVDLLQYWERFFWFTVETGLVDNPGGIKPFGAAIITSSTEIHNSAGKEVPKEKLLISSLVNSSFATYSVQQKYFYVRSFDELAIHLNALQEFASAHSWQRMGLAGITRPL
jgi:phenylalanine-4-hydroxylase